MKGLFWRWILNALALVLTANVIKGIEVEGFAAPLMAALVLGVVNAVIRPILSLFSLPITIMTFGLFSFVLNGLLFMFVGRVVEGFSVQGILPAIIGSIVMSVFSGILTWMVKD